MPAVPVVLAIGGAVASAAAAVPIIGTALAYGVGAITVAATTVLSTVGSVLGIKAVAGAVTSSTIQAVMQKKAAGEALKAQEEEALRFYQQEDKARAEREYAEIQRIEAEKKQVDLEEKHLITTAQGQQIETLSNLLTAKTMLQSQSAPVILTTPAPVANLSWIDNINNTIYGWFN